MEREEKKNIKSDEKHSKQSGRIKARDYAYQLIFSYLFTGELDEARYGEMAQDKALSHQDVDYLKATFDNVVNNRDDIEAMIVRYANGYTLERIYKPDLAVLMLAIGEMKYNDSVPMVVAINEALNIIKNYSTEKSKAFVNGILASVYKELNV